MTEAEFYKHFRDLVMRHGGGITGIIETCTEIILAGEPGTSEAVARQRAKRIARLAKRRVRTIIIGRARSARDN